MKYLACVVALVGTAASASAAWSVVSRNSKVLAEGDGVVANQIISNSMAAFSETVASPGEYGGANARQTSSLTSAGAIVSNYADASSYAKPWSGGQYGSSIGSSTFKLVFNVSSTLSYKLDGFLYGYPGGKVTLKNLVTNQTLVSFNPFDPEKFNFAGTVGPGNYELDVSVNVNGSAGSNWFTGVDATLTLIPGPSAMAAFGLFGSMAIRRRR